jgi:putative IMPACT (imprinted ancient) family translation regulator
MSKLPDYIKTIVNESEFRLKEKGSTFISISKPIKTELDAELFLNSIRKKYYDATHHCYSYKLACGTLKYSDDGEPNGTAGIRIFNAQNHFELTNLATIVIRHYGGIKLGVGPLGKTYYETALQNLGSSIIEELTLFKEVEISYQFEHSNLVHHLISKHSLRTKQNLFEPSPKIICSIDTLNLEKFSKEISSLSSNQITFLITDKICYLRK